jgi:hypothetical protein
MAANEPVNSTEEAYNYAGYYLRRWKTERFHYVLKSGCAIEKPRERSIDKTATLILMYSIIAAMILNMTCAGRLTPCLPCSVLLGEDEWKLLYCAANKTRKEPKKPYTIKEAADCLGRQGGPKEALNDEIYEWSRNYSMFTVRPYMRIGFMFEPQENNK